MNKIVAACVGILLLAATSQSVATPEVQIPQDISTAISAFSDQLEEGYPASAFFSGSTLLQESVNQEIWIDQTRRIFNSLGKINQRTFLKSRLLTSYPMLPDGSYLIVYHELKMERKEKALEIVLMCLEDEQWKICAYTVR